MTWWQIILLGAVQGLTEFLPVSSTGHLYVVQAFTKWVSAEKYASLDIFLHLPTIMAVILFFYKDIASVFRDLFAPRTVQERRAASHLILMIVVSVVSTTAVYFLFKKAFEYTLRDEHLLGAQFLFSAVILIAVSFKREGRMSEGDLRVWHAVVIGVAQGLAIVPAISRSGITVVAALFIGLKAPAAFRFSFLLSIPTIILAWLYDAVTEPGALSNVGIGAGPLVAAFVIAFLLALLAVYLLRGAILRNRLWLFALYLVPFGLLVHFYFR